MASIARCPRCGAPLGGGSLEIYIDSVCHWCGVPVAAPIASPAEVPRPSASAAGGDHSSHRNAPRCQHCGEPLSVYEAARGAACSRTACQHREAADLSRRRRAALAAYHESLHAHGHELAHELGWSRELPIVTAVTPANDWPLAPLPASRRGEFLDRLERLAIEAAASEQSADEIPSQFLVETVPEYHLTAAQQSYLGQACAVCRGHCCRQGGVAAFIDVRGLRRRFEADPELTVEAILADYVDRFPDISYEDSCVFHTATGCNLPPHLRGEMCNAWICGGLAELVEQLPADGGVTVLIAATLRDEPQLVRIGLSDGATLVLQDGAEGPDAPDVM